MNYSILKIIAMLAMYIDHVGAISNIDIYRYIGRISFVIYAFLVSNAMRHTGNKRSYIMGLFKYALISEIFYDYFMFYIKYPRFFSFIDYYRMDVINSQNVFFTLAFGALSCYLYDIYKQEKNKKYILVIILTIFLPYIIKADYGLFGALFIFIFYLCKNRFQSFVVASAFSFVNYGIYGLYSYIPFSLIGALLIYLYNGKKGTTILNKRVYYLFYPAHMFFLCLIFMLL